MLVRRRQSAFSLIELLIVIALMGILAGLAIPSTSGTIHQQLEIAAQVVASDLDYARSLAVSNSSTYRFTFDLAQNKYVLTHADASRSELNSLPRSSMRSASDPANAHTFQLADIPRIGPPAVLSTVQSGGTTPVTVTTLEFDALGATTRPQPTVIWLTCGSGDSQRYISVTVDPATGQTVIGSVQATSTSTAN